MWKLGQRLRNSFSGNTDMAFFIAVLILSHVREEKSWVQERYSQGI